jgi:hypothetical protein
VRSSSRLIALIVSSVALATTVFTSSAGAGIPAPPSDVTPLTVLKTVSGPVPAGTTFTATVQCDDNIIQDGLDVTDTATVTLDATGQPTSIDTITFDDPGSCTVTETANGGAVSTTYACQSVLPIDSTGVGAQQVLQLCGTAGPQADPITVNPEVVAGSMTVTIHNTFNEPTPQPAAQVVAQPVFTG